MNKRAQYSKSDPRELAHYERGIYEGIITHTHTPFIMHDE